MEPTLATWWFYKHGTGDVLQQERVGVVCSVCGNTVGAVCTVPRKKVLRSTFSNYDLLRIRDGERVCPACAWYFDNQELRRSGWWLTEAEAREMTKRDWLPLLREHVANGTPADGYYLIKPLGLTGKHIALVAPLNCRGAHALRVGFDLQVVTVDKRFLQLVDDSHKLRERHSWKEIRTGNYYAKHILDWPRRTEFVRLRRQVDHWRGTVELALAEFLWSKPKEEEGEELGVDDNAGLLGNFIRGFKDGQQGAA